MAHSLSAKKRMRQTLKRNARNRARKKQVKLQVRKLLDAVQAGDKARAQIELKAAVKTIDQVAAKGSMHKNTAARKKSRLQRRINALAAT